MNYQLIEYAVRRYIDKKGVLTDKYYEDKKEITICPSN